METKGSQATKGLPGNSPSHVKWCSLCRTNHLQLRPNCGVLDSIFSHVWTYQNPYMSGYGFSGWPVHFLFCPLVVRTTDPFFMFCTIFYHHNHWLFSSALLELLFSKSWTTLSQKQHTATIFSLLRKLGKWDSLGFHYLFLKQIWSHAYWFINWQI